MKSIRATRTAKGISQKELARKAGIDARTLRKIENGEHVSDVSMNAVLNAMDSYTIPSDSAEEYNRRTKLSLVKFCWSLVAVLAGIWIVTSLVMPYYRDAYMFGLACSAIVLVLSGPAFLVTSWEPRWNTRIEIDADTTQTGSLPLLTETMKVWIGRSDLTLGPVSTVGERLNLVAFSRFELSDYHGISARLQSLGLRAKITRLS